MDSRTIPDHAVEYFVPSIRSPLVLSVRTDVMSHSGQVNIRGVPETVNSQWKAMLARVSPTTMPGADQIMIFRRPIMSMYFRANSVKTKLVTETIRPTAVGWLKPIILNSVAL